MKLANFNVSYIITVHVKCTP